LKRPVKVNGKEKDSGCVKDPDARFDVNVVCKHPGEEFLWEI